MNQPPALSLTLRVGAAAADSRRGIVRAHPEALLALGLREWDAIEIVGARTTGAVVAATKVSAPTAVLVVDEVVAANCGLGDDSLVTVQRAAVSGAATIAIQGLPAAAQDVPDRILRSALLGKVVRVGDSVSLLPRDLGPDFPSWEASSSLRNRLGAEWSTRLLTIVSTEPSGIVSIQPSTAITAGTSSNRADSSNQVTSSSPVGSPNASGSKASPQPNPAAVSTGPAQVSSDGPPEEAALPLDALIGLRDQATVLAQWLSLALDRADLLTTLGASPHLGVMVVGSAGVGKVTVVRAVASGRTINVLDGPSTGALEPASRLEAVRAAAERTREQGGILLVTDIDALLPAKPDPVGSLIVDRLRSVVSHSACALVVTCVRAEDADSRLREPDLCDRVLDLPPPNGKDRAALLGAMLSSAPTGELDLVEIAERSPGYVAGDLRALVREAALRAAGRAEDESTAMDSVRIEQEDLLGALTVIRPLARAESTELALGSISLDDVGDMEEVRQALTEAVLWPLEHPEAFDRLGVEPPRGVLLYGPPGCGKTFLVRALATSGRLTVHIVKGAELMDKWVGSSEKAVRDLFRLARDSAPSLVFLDEIDALAPRRGQSSDSGVGDRVVAALLTELDGAEPLDGVVVLGATNRPELIDPALLRPGRLERLVFVPPPDAEARAEILRAAGKGVPLASDVDIDLLAKDLDGFSAADCAALLRESALVAMRRDISTPEVTASDVSTARQSVRPSLDPEQVDSLRAYAEDREK